MALINPETLEIPSVSQLFPTTRRRRVVKPCGTGAAYRRHYRRGGSELPIDPACAAWHAEEMRIRRTGK